MTRFGLTAVVLAAGALLWSSSARADLVTLNGSQNDKLPAITLLESSSSPLRFSGACCPNIQNIHLDAEGTPPEESGDFSSNTLSIRTTGSVTRTIWLWVTETGITSPTGTDQFTSGLTTNLLTGSAMSATLSTYLNPSNKVSPISGVGPVNGEVQLDQQTFSAGGFQTITVDQATGAGPYALAEVYEITFGPGAGTANLTIDLETEPTTTVVPEPATLALLGTGLLGIAGLRRWR